MKKFYSVLVVFVVLFSVSGISIAEETVETKVVLTEESAAKKASMTEEELKFQERFDWWPTSAQPCPVLDEKKGGYWWMPKNPTAGTCDKGKCKELWGNRGYIYVRKVIFDYMEEDLPAPKPQEMRPSLIIRKIIKNVKVYFDYDKADLRDDALRVLAEAVRSLEKNPDASILITGNCDIRGTEQYNDKLGRKRGDSVKNYMQTHGISDDRIRIISRGKLDALAPVTDLVGMAKDRNAQFMVAVIEEVNLPYPGKPEEIAASGEDVRQVDENKYLVEKEEKVEGDIKVSTKDYVIKKGDTLWCIAERELGSGKRWNNIYRLNKSKIKDPNRLKAGTKIVIPVE
ncbi:MAG: OmpA family protein [Candidatus Omnitrophica bacterium]|nr:OmpA family protein [Candidatus Omnitrophota bacterium]